MATNLHITIAGEKNSTQHIGRLEKKCMQGNKKSMKEICKSESQNKEKGP